MRENSRIVEGCLNHCSPRSQEGCGTQTLWIQEGPSQLAGEPSTPLLHDATVRGLRGPMPGTCLEEVEMSLHWGCRLGVGAQGCYCWHGLRALSKAHAFQTASQGGHVQLCMGGSPRFRQGVHWVVTHHICTQWASMIREVLQMSVLSALPASLSDM